MYIDYKLATILYQDGDYYSGMIMQRNPFKKNSNILPGGTNNAKSKMKINQI